MDGFLISNLTTALTLVANERIANSYDTNGLTTHSTQQSEPFAH